MGNSKKHIRRICLLALLTFLSLALVFTGCKPAEEITSEPESSSAVSQSEEIDFLGKYDEPLEITFIKESGSLESRFEDLRGITGEYWDENRWTELYEETLNIKSSYPTFHTPKSLISEELL